MKYIDLVHNLCMHRVHVPAASPPTAVLTADEAHHARHVLRLDVGDAVVAFDGRGHEWNATIASVTRTEVTLALGDARTPVAEPPVSITLAVGLLKGEQMDDVVRDATMLGVVRIMPLLSAHVAVPKAAWQTRGIDRWQRVAVASAKQCQRAVVPDVLAAQSLSEAITPWQAGSIVICVEPGLGGAVEVPPTPATKQTLLLVGPEGGWAPDEVALALARGAVPLALGPRTLRAESAPGVALSVLWARWGWV